MGPFFLPSNSITLPSCQTNAIKWCPALISIFGSSKFSAATSLCASYNDCFDPSFFLTSNLQFFKYSALSSGFIFCVL